MPGDQGSVLQQLVSMQSYISDTKHRYSEVLVSHVAVLRSHILIDARVILQKKENHDFVILFV